MKKLLFSVIILLSYSISAEIPDSLVQQVDACINNYAQHKKEHESKKSTKFEDSNLYKEKQAECCRIFDQLKSFSSEELKSKFGKDRVGHAIKHCSKESAQKGLKV